MSFDPINQTEKAGENFSTFVENQLKQDTPGFLRQVLDALCEYKFVFGLEKR